MPSTYYLGLSETLRNPHVTDSELIAEWKKRYEGLLASHSKSKLEIVEGLVLTHPYWWKKFGKIPERGREWNALDSNKCEYGRIHSGEKCPFIDASMEKDHWWPSSLGGPTDPRNLVFLCDTHNKAKSNSVEFFDFSNEPGWLNDRLKRISVLLSRY